MLIVMNLYGREVGEFSMVVPDGRSHTIIVALVSRLSYADITTAKSDKFETLTLALERWRIGSRSDNYELRAIATDDQIPLLRHAPGFRPLVFERRCQRCGKEPQ